MLCYIAGSFFNDMTGMFKTRANENVPAANSDTTSTLQVAMTAGQQTQWLMLWTVDGMDGAYGAFFSSLFVSSFLYSDTEPPMPGPLPFAPLLFHSSVLLTHFLLGDHAHVPEAPTP